MDHAAEEREMSCTNSLHVDNLDPLQYEHVLELSWNGVEAMGCQALCYAGVLYGKLLECAADARKPFFICMGARGGLLDMSIFNMSDCHCSLVILVVCPRVVAVCEIVGLCKARNRASEQSVKMCVCHAGVFLGGLVDCRIVLAERRL